MSRPPQRLGRGLATLFNDDRGPAGTVTDLPLISISPGPFQPRTEISPASLTDLIASITAQGVLQPILVRPNPEQPGQFQIIAGERRWRAAQAAGLHTIPVHLRPLTDKEAVAAALVENLQRQDLDPIEEAEGYQRLLGEFVMTPEALGQLVGKSRSHIANTIRLLGLPTSVRAHVKAGLLTAGHARALLGHIDPEQTANAVISQGLNVRQTEALTRVPAQAHNRSAAPRDADDVALEEGLTGLLGLRVRILRSGVGGTVQISYGTLDQLDGIVRLLQS